jgi:hypothetical protein
MSALDKVPSNIHFLSPLGFQSSVKKLPNVNFYLQAAAVPSVSMPPVDQENPFVKIPRAGDHITYDELRVTFKVDENVLAYSELYNWLRGLGFPDSFDEYAALKRSEDILKQELVSDISLIVLSNLKNPVVEFIFRDAFPTSLSELNFESTDEDVIFINCQASFAYTLYDVKVLV